MKKNVNCELANNLISARIDHELAGEDVAALDAHLAECEACRQTLAEMELADAAMLRVFSPRREAAAELANRVSQAIPQNLTAAHPARVARFAPGAARPGLMRWMGFVAAAAAGFIAAVIFVKPAGLGPAQVHISAQPAPLRPVARLTLATGAVFTRPVNQQSWQPISPEDPIALGTAVRTGQTSKCELQLPDGSCLRLNSATEARFTGERSVQISAGRLWSALPRNASLFRVSAGQTTVTARGAVNDHGTAFELACAPDTATVTVQCGSADVAGNVPSTTVHGGEVLHAPSAAATFACQVMPDPLLTTQWQDELLVLKPANDPQVLARIDQLMTRIVSDGGPDAPCSFERELRAGGQAWCPPMACYLRDRSTSADPANRRAAVRLLADLAPPSSVPDLIDLLDDEDGEIRSRAAAALRRLTGQTLGYPPDQCAVRPDPAARAAWRNWWERASKK